MGVTVPADVVQYIRQASDGTGIGFQTVACQVNMESGFNQWAVSPTGAQGPYQFEPGTWAGYGHGSPFNWEDSTRAYIAYMNELSRIEGGNIFDMLAAYNAGPANLPAGYGYATAILNCSRGGINVGPHAPQPIPNDIPSPSGTGSTDDWSQKVRNSASQIWWSGHNLLDASAGIERL